MIVNSYDNNVGATDAVVNAAISANAGDDQKQREKDNHLFISNCILRSESHDHLCCSP